jgi:hypothetical protein
MSEWYFEPFSANGGFNAAAGRRLLEGAENLQQPEKLAREAIQNSCDAEDDPSIPVRVRFRSRSVPGDSAGQLIRQLQLAGTGSPSERGLIEVGDELQLLLIEDFNTVGLGGTERADVSSRPEDNFVRLCRNVGDTQELAGRGGTFGFGKSVYWSHSRLFVVAFYTRFRPTDRTAGASARFMTVGWFHDHDHADARYTGRAWLGDVKNGGTIVAPLVDEAAHQMAESLGIDRRSESDRGTSILIVGAHEVDREYMDHVRAAVETHYWPRLIEGGLEVDFEIDGAEVGAPDLEARVDLRDYMHAYRLATRDPVPDELPEGRAVIPLTYTPADSPNAVDLGRIGALVRHGAADIDQEDDPDSSLTRKGVALIRGPRMVVTYYQWPSLPAVPCGAVFVASDQVEDILRRSEPPAHDSWSDQSNDLSEDGRKVVRNLMGKLRRTVNDYLESFIESESSDATTCPALGKELARYLPLTAGAGGPGSAKRFATVQFISRPRRIPGEEGHQRVAAEFQVGVTQSHIRRFRKQFDRRPRSVEVGVKIEPVVDTGQRLHSHPIGVDMLSGRGTDSRRIDGSLIFPLTGESDFRISVVSEPLPEGEITVDMTVSAQLRFEEAENGRGD